jgi:hypothetical protein
LPAESDTCKRSAFVDLNQVLRELRLKGQCIHKLTVRPIGCRLPVGETADSLSALQGGEGKMAG